MLSDIKLVIWDLDETFWEGTLSEGPITPIQANIARVKQLCTRGVMNSICSKNNLDEARAKLEELGVWDSFVFPSVMWAAKGQQVRQIIERMKLRAVNVLVVDDNALNREEIKFHNEGIHVLDPSDWVDVDSSDWGKDDTSLSRLQNYKLLESKLEAITDFTGDNEAFLESSNIRCRVCPMDLTRHDMDRVVEVLNRTNQLNFTKRRFRSGLMQLVYELRQSEAKGYIIYVDDNYGHYGLCGFASVSGAGVVEDFAFSCRLLDMGVENAVLACLKDQHSGLEVPFADEIADIRADWVQIIEGDGPEDEGTQAAAVERQTSMLMPTACFSEVIAPFMQPEVNLVSIPDLPAMSARIIRKSRRTSLLFWSGKAPELVSLYEGAYDILHIAVVTEVILPTAWLPVVGQIPMPLFLNANILHRHPDLLATTHQIIEDRGEMFGRRLSDLTTYRQFKACLRLSKLPFVARQLAFSADRYRRDLAALRARLPAHTRLAITAFSDNPDSTQFTGPWAVLNDQVRAECQSTTAVARAFAANRDDTFILEAIEGEQMREDDLSGHLNHAQSVAYARILKERILDNRSLTQAA